MSEAPFDVAKVRQDFPILHQQIYGNKPLVYLDNAATSQKPQVVIDSLIEYYSCYNANVHRALHYLGEQATARYEAVREKVATFIGAHSPESILFTRGTTEGINLVAYTWAKEHIQAGDEIIVTGMEHHSNLVPWQLCAEQTGAKLKLLPVFADGTLDLFALRGVLSERTRLVAVTHMSNVLGTVNDVREIARLAHDAGAAVLIDAAQSVPHMPVNMQELGADFLVFSGHKCCGPTGVGILAVKPDRFEDMPPFMGGGEMISRVGDLESTWAEVPYKFEAGTPNIADVIGLGVALDYLTEVGMEKIQSYEKQLTDYLIQELRSIPHLQIFGAAKERGGAVSFALEDVHPHDLSQYVDQQGIAIRAGHLCAQPLMRRLGVPAVSRASVYFYNTTEEIDRLKEAIIKAQQFFDHG